MGWNLTIIKIAIAHNARENPLMQTFPDAGPDFMSFTLPATLQERRIKAAKLLEAVIEEAIEPRMAINRWPIGPEMTDPSLECAYLALWHFESDEVPQKTELFYLDAQLELLQQIANHLKANQNLPPYILRTYLPASPVRFYYSRSVLSDLQNYVVRLWQQAQCTISEAMDLIQSR